MTNAVNGRKEFKKFAVSKRSGVRERRIIKINGE